MVRVKVKYIIVVLNLYNKKLGNSSSVTQLVESRTQKLKCMG